MPKALWQGTIIAEASSDEVQIVEGNVYFPQHAVDKEFLHVSDHHTICGWKGTASYYDVVVAGKTNENAAWYYPKPKEEAKNIEGYIAFWRGVQIES